ncbi:MAG: hypothetical protein ACKOHI_07995, partial [Phycisphaerales bacterium]
MVLSQQEGVPTSRAFAVILEKFIDGTGRVDDRPVRYLYADGWLTEADFRERIEHGLPVTRRAAFEPCQQRGCLDGVHPIVTRGAVLFPQSLRLACRGDGLARTAERIQG